MNPLVRQRPFQVPLGRPSDGMSLDDQGRGDRLLGMGSVVAPGYGRSRGDGEQAA